MRHFIWCTCTMYVRCWTFDDVHGQLDRKESIFFGGLKYESSALWSMFKQKFTFRAASSWRWPEMQMLGLHSMNLHWLCVFVFSLIQIACGSEHNLAIVGEMFFFCHFFLHHNDKGGNSAFLQSVSYFFITWPLRCHHLSIPTALFSKKLWFCGSRGLQRFSLAGGQWLRVVTSSQMQLNGILLALTTAFSWKTWRGQCLDFLSLP